MEQVALAFAVGAVAGSYVGWKYGSAEAAHITEAVDHFKTTVKQAEVDAVAKVRKLLESQS